MHSAKKRKRDGGRPLMAGLPSAVDGRHTTKSQSLPCVNVKTLGESGTLCRVPMQKHSAKLPVFIFLFVFSRI